MRIEHGIRLGAGPVGDARRGGKLAVALARFDWVYFGAEFCENLLDARLAAEAAALQALGKKVCLQTPLLTDAGLGRLEALFSGLSELARAGRLDPDRLEVTVNDLGALELAAALKTPIRLAAGRQLLGNAFLLERGALSALSARALDFFARRGVRRYELATSGRLHKTNFSDKRLGLEPGGFALTVYYPYLNLTTTRTCLVGMPDIPAHEAVKGVTCSRECLACAFRVTHPWVKEKLFIRGNTVFMEFPRKFYSSAADLESRRIDRLVYCPYP